VNETDEVRERVCARLAAEARRGKFILVAHDDNSAEQVDRSHNLGCVMSEFAVTLDAARRARELGMGVGMGAPNVVRGGSLNGNIGAADLARRGLLDVLLADYDAPSLLYAAVLIARERVASLEGAVQLITRNPARVAELADRGSLEPGLRADVIVVHAADEVPVVTDYVVAGVPRFSLHLPSS
jgi:alpha-D-ribose 1-methylphosphonate 5-triphosphate diphosphatase